MRLIGGYETSASSYQSTLHNIPEERKYRLPVRLQIISKLLLHRATAVCSVIHTKRVNALSGQRVEVVIVEHADTHMK